MQVALLGSGITNSTFARHLTKGGHVRFADRDLAKARALRSAHPKVIAFIAPGSRPRWRRFGFGRLMNYFHKGDIT